MSKDITQQTKSELISDIQKMGLKMTKMAKVLRYYREGHRHGALEAGASDCFCLCCTEYRRIMEIA